jgi:hypothetical protein
MKLNSEKSTVCFLVINRIQELPNLSIQSVLDSTNSQIYIGYLNKQDILGLPESPRIQYITLENNNQDADKVDSGFYQDFSTDSFYRIVQYKWQLITKVLSLGYKFVIYSDTDIYWNLNPVPELERTFELRQESHILIQSFTDELSDPKLCMGFVAFRNSVIVQEFIEKCAKRHGELASQNPRVGDDDVVTLMYRELDFPNWLTELPQTTFPVGRMLKLYKRSSVMPGLSSPTPFIFHANYVVGLQNKRLLIKLFIRNYSIRDRKHNLGIRFWIILNVKRLRHTVRLFRNFLNL